MQDICIEIDSSCVWRATIAQIGSASDGNISLVPNSEILVLVARAHVVFPIVFLTQRGQLYRGPVVISELDTGKSGAWP
jgi:hypothetical protein